MDIGAQLRQARESRGISIETLASTTRISPRALEGIERNDLSVVPPRPYNRGFVAAFAREVGLNPDDVVTRYFAQFEEEAPPPPIESVSLGAASPEPGRWSGWGPTLGALSVLALVALLFSDRTEAPPVTSPAPVGTSGSNGATDARLTAAVNARDAVPASRSSAPAENVVVLETDAPSWIEARVDGTRTLYQMVPGGATHTLRGREITLRLGDAGAVRWSVNGRPPVALGAPGQVRNVKVPSEQNVAR